MGTGGLAPPHTTTFFETACKMEDPRTIHPLAFRVHTHGLGNIGKRCLERSWQKNILYLFFVKHFLFNIHLLNGIFSNLSTNL